MLNFADTLSDTKYMQKIVVAFQSSCMSSEDV